MSDQPSEPGQPVAKLPPGDLYQHWVSNFLTEMGRPLPPRTPEDLAQAMAAGLRATFDSWSLEDAEPITRNLDLRLEILHDSLREVRADGPTVTSQGYWIVEVACARTGLQSYVDAKSVNGKRVELRRLDAITEPESLASWIHSPAIIYHQPVINLQNSPEFKRGYVFAGPEVRKLADGEDYLIFQIVLDHPELVEGVRTRRFTEVSAGYGALFVAQPGVYKGVRYDGLQTRIRINHIAFLPPGMARAGKFARVLLDSAEEEAQFYFDSSISQGVTFMAESTNLTSAAATLNSPTMRVYLDSKTSVDINPDQAALVQRVISEKDQQIGTLQDQIQTLKTEKTDLQGRHDSLETDKQALTTEVADLKKKSGSSNTGAMVKALHYAKPYLSKDFNYDAIDTLNVQDVQLTALKAKLPKADFTREDWKDPVYVNGYFDSQIVNAPQAPEKPNVGSGVPTDKSRQMYDSLTPVEQPAAPAAPPTQRADSNPNPYYAQLQAPTRERLNLK